MSKKQNLVKYECACTHTNSVGGVLVHRDRDGATRTGRDHHPMLRLRTRRTPVVTSNASKIHKGK